MPYLTAVLNALQRRPNVLEHLGTRSHQVDHSLVIAERPGHRVWNIARVTGLLGDFKDRCAGTIEYADDCGRRTGQLTSWGEIVLCRGECRQHHPTQNRTYASHGRSSACCLD